MKENDPLVRMSFSIEPALYEAFEQLIRESGKANRSEYVRDMIRKQLTRKRCAAEEIVSGTISVLYDTASSGINTRLFELLDTAAIAMHGSSRFKLSPSAAMLVFVCTGKGKEIRELAELFRSQRGVLQAEFVITSAAGN